MDTDESKTAREKKEHVLGQRLPEKDPQTPAHLQPEARRSTRGLYRLLPIATALVVVGLALVIILGIASGE